MQERGGDTSFCQLRKMFVHQEDSDMMTSPAGTERPQWLMAWMRLDEYHGDYNLFLLGLSQSGQSNVSQADGGEEINKNLSFKHCLQHCNAVLSGTE